MLQIKFLVELDRLILDLRSIRHRNQESRVFSEEECELIKSILNLPATNLSRFQCKGRMRYWLKLIVTQIEKIRAYGYVIKFEDLSVLEAKRDDLINHLNSNGYDELILEI